MSDATATVATIEADTRNFILLHFRDLFWIVKKLSLGLHRYRCDKFSTSFRLLFIQFVFCVQFFFVAWK